MDKNNTHIPVREGMKHVAKKPESLPPAIPGTPNSHGVKFSVKMTPEDKKQLLMRLEEWRKARKEKLAASILAKQKPVAKPKASVPSLPLESKPVPQGGIINSKPQIRQSVFERLYQNNGKLKKQEVPANCTRPQQIKRPIIHKSVPLPLEKSKKPEITQKSSNPELGSLPVKTVQAGEDKKLRRSISMVYRQKCRTDNAKMRKSVSVKNLHEMHLKTQNTDHRHLQTLQHDGNTKKEIENEAAAKLAIYTTPKNTNSLTSSSLRSKLEDWLKVNGHPLEGYRHLRCFGIKDNPKPLPEVPNVPVDEVFENSYYATAPNTPLEEENKENVTPPTVVQQVDLKDVENWLKELHRLILELKYPSERCEEWLSAIRKKCTSCSQMPIYWECLAALNESKGDLKSAIEDYERVIIKGGQVDTVGESLAQLFDKMMIDQGERSKAKLDKGLDPKNIFKSTIIKFALQQKAIKNLGSEIEPGVRQQLYIATPVRRSTRLQTPLKSVEEVASLQTLAPEFRKNVTFKPNESLLSGD